MKFMVSIPILLLALVAPCLAKAAPACGPGAIPRAQNENPAASTPVPQEGPPPSTIEDILKSRSSESGYLSAEQIKAWVINARMTEYRISDLLSDLHSERWNISEEARSAFNGEVAAARTAMDGFESARANFEKRPDSASLAFQVYVAADPVVPKLDSIGRVVSQYENTSFGSQYSKAGRQLFDAQQTIGAYLGFLLNSQDQMLFALQDNLAGCQRNLGAEMRATPAHVKVVRNTRVVYPRRATLKPGGAAPQANPKPTPAAAPAAKPDSPAAGPPPAKPNMP